LLVLIAIWNRWVVFGSVSGRWVFPYIGDTPALDLLFGVFVVALAFALRGPLEQLVTGGGRSREVAVVLATLLVGIALELYLHSRYSQTLAALVRSNSANGYFFAAQRLDVVRVLSQFPRALAGMPMHVHSNMPGKVIFYRWLLQITQDPTALGVAIVAVSNLTGVAVYVLAKFLFADRLVAWAAMLLVMFTPGKVEFQPILNTVSPVLIFCALTAVVAAFQNRRLGWAAVAGALLCGEFLFEPLPFALGLVFVAVTAAIAYARHAYLRLLLIYGLALAGFVVSAGLLYLCFGFNIVTALGYCVNEAADFNMRVGRTYAVWVAGDLKEYFYGAGALSSVLALCSWSQAKTWRGDEASVVSLFLLVALFATIAGLDLSGINRGEVTRLWIFLMPVQALVVARYCVRTLSGGAYLAAWGGALLQTVICLGSVGFVLP